MAQNGALRTKQRKAIAALLEESTVIAAAQRAGVGRRTLHRWLAQPVFRAELRKVQDAVLASSTASLVGLSQDAIATLRDVLTDDDVAAGVRVRAALGALDRRDKVIETQEIMDRLEAVERLLQ